MIQAPPAAPAEASGLVSWLLTGTSMSAVVGGVFAALKYFGERKKDRDQRIDELEQRRGELRWRQAQAAKELLDEMLSDAPACAALDMLDSWSRTFEVAPGQRETITAERWLNALQSGPDRADDPAALFVRDSFDSLFYFMAMFEHYVDHQFVHFRDVVFPLDYYVRILAEDKAVHKAYLTEYGMGESLRFLARFPDWAK